MRRSTLVLVGSLLGLAGLALWREGRAAAATAPQFGAELERLDLIFAGVMGPRLSPAGLDALKRHEGYSSTKYRDQAGHWTVGYGHKVKPGEQLESVTRDQAEELLRADVAEAEGAVSRLVGVPLTQEQFDALVSFTFNLGADALARSTLLEKLNAGDYEGARAELGRWVYVTLPSGEKVASDGLRRRRADEAARFA